MASHVHGPDQSLSAARITAYSGVAVALIGLTGGVIHLVGDDGGRSMPVTSAVATSAPTTTSLKGTPDTGLRFSPLVDGKLVVSGSTVNDATGMYVVIGPKSSGGYDTGCGNVVDQRWQTEVTTDASWPNYPLVTVPAYGSCVGTTKASAYRFTFQDSATTTPSAPYPADCVRLYGASCFTGPGYGPPTTYQPRQ
jgi:hypothetical protein